MKKQFLSFSALLLCSSAAFAQSQTVGALNISDNDPAPLSRNNITIKAPASSTLTTDQTLVLPGGAVPSVGQVLSVQSTSGSTANLTWSSGSGWGLLGNTTTNPATNYIGTNDAVDFVTKTNNTERLRITSAGQLLINTSSPLTGGTNAKVVINNGATNGALQIVDGTQGAGKVLTSDANGVATWTDGSSTAWALTGNTGTNPATNYIGTADSKDLVTKTNNAEAMRVTSGQKLLIGTSTVPTGGTNAKVIINNGTTNGALQIKDGTEANGRVLTSDANGVATWRINSTAFISYYNSPAQNIISNRSGLTPLRWTTMSSDDYGAFNTTTGIFTAPKTGVYTFYAKTYIGSPTTNWMVMIMNIAITPASGGATYYCRLSENNTNTPLYQLNGVGSVYLQQGDQAFVGLDCQVSTGASTFTTTAQNTDSYTNNTGTKGWVTSLTITF